MEFSSPYRDAVLNNPLLCHLPSPQPQHQRLAVLDLLPFHQRAILVPLKATHSN